MAALTGPRATPSEEGVRRRMPVKGGVKIYQGSLVVLDGGYAKPGVVGAGLVAVGRAEQTVDAVQAADGALTIDVERGVFKWANAAADAVTAAEVGKTAFVYDDATVAKTDGGQGARSAAGTVFQVDADGVWVMI